MAEGRLVDAFLRIFCCNDFDNNYLPPHSALPNFQHAKEAFIAQIAGKDSLVPMLPALEIYSGYVQGDVGRSLLQMREGYIG